MFATPRGTKKGGGGYDLPSSVGCAYTKIPFSSGLNWEVGSSEGFRVRIGHDMTGQVGIGIGWMDGQAKKSRPQLPRSKQSSKPTPARLVGRRPNCSEQIAIDSASRVYTSTNLDLLPRVTRNSVSRLAILARPTRPTRPLPARSCLPFALGFRHTNAVGALPFIALVGHARRHAHEWTVRMSSSRRRLSRVPSHY